MKRAQTYFNAFMYVYFFGLLLIAIVSLSGCKSIEEIRSEIWSVDSKDGTIYRVLNNGTEQFVYCTDKSAEKFKAIHQNDLEDLIIQATQVQRQCK